MSTEIKQGALVAIPCRACGKVMLPFTVDFGSHRLKCLRCNRYTKVTVMTEFGRLRIWSELDP
jgi:phage FluMu protein Com